MGSSAQFSAPDWTSPTSIPGFSVPCEAERAGDLQGFPLRCAAALLIGHYENLFVAQTCDRRHQPFLFRCVSVPPTMSLVDVPSVIGQGLLDARFVLRPTPYKQFLPWGQLSYPANTSSPRADCELAPSSPLCPGRCRLGRVSVRRCHWLFGVRVMRSGALCPLPDSVLFLRATAPSALITSINCP